MGKVMYAGGKIKMTVPVADGTQIPSDGIALSELPVGTIVMIPENDVLVPFCLAKHDYESGLNGTGRTLLVRRYIYGDYVWNDSPTNAYLMSSISTWLNTTYKGLLIDSVQNAMGTTQFYYTLVGDNVTTTKTKRSVFLLSLYELGITVSNANNEGSTLPIASTILSTSTKDGEWTRTPNTSSSDKAWGVLVPGLDAPAFTGPVNVTPYGVRPCFTLPATTLVDPEPNADGTVNLKV